MKVDITWYSKKKGCLTQAINEQLLFFSFPISLTDENKMFLTPNCLWHIDTYIHMMPVSINSPVCITVKGVDFILFIYLFLHGSRDHSELLFMFTWI